MLPRTLAQRALRLASRTTNTRTFTSLRTVNASPLRRPTTAFLQRPSPIYPSRLYSSPGGPTIADQRIEDITELYATAQDEFEIAMEETEKGTVYAEDDRKAAREELEKVLEAYKSTVEGEDKELAEEVKRRIGQRVRELEMGVVRMEEMAMEHD